MDNIDDPTTGGTEKPEDKETNKVRDPEQPPTPPATTDPPDEQLPVDSVEAIAKRVAALMTEERAQYLTLDGDKQVSNVDKAYGRR